MCVCTVHATAQTYDRQISRMLNELYRGMNVLFMYLSNTTMGKSFNFYPPPPPPHPPPTPPTINQDPQAAENSTSEIHSLQNTKKTKFYIYDITTVLFFYEEVETLLLILSRNICNVSLMLTLALLLIR